MMSPKQIFEQLVKKVVKDAAVLSVPLAETNPLRLHDISDAIYDLKECAKSFKKHHPNGCAGLAANQIGLDVRIFVILTDKGFRAFVNPEFTPAGPLVSKLESCLSFPGKTTAVKRYTAVYGKSKDGKRVLLKGLSAQAFQHELDHLNGIHI